MTADYLGMIAGMVGANQAMWTIGERDMETICWKCRHSYALETTKLIGDWYVRLCVPCRNAFTDYLDADPERRGIVDKLNDTEERRYAALYRGDAETALGCQRQWRILFAQLREISRSWCPVPVPAKADADPGAGGV